MKSEIDNSFVDHEEVTESVQHIFDTRGNFYSSKLNIRRHLKSHSETNEHFYIHCGIIFTSNYNLARPERFMELLSFSNHSHLVPWQLRTWDFNIVPYICTFVPLNLFSCHVLSRNIQWDLFIFINFKR